MNIEMSNSKKVNKDELNEIVNRLYTNKNKKKKENENSNTIDLSGKTDSKNSKVNFSEIY